MTAESDMPDRCSSVQFCALEYRPQNSSEEQSGEPQIVALVLKSSDDDLQIRVDPDWQSVVGGADSEFVESLFADFKERAESDPDALFRQVSSLNFGVLVTYETGSNLDDHPALSSLCRRFVEP